MGTFAHTGHQKGISRRAVIIRVHMPSLMPFEAARRLIGVGVGWGRRPGVKCSIVKRRLLVARVGSGFWGQRRLSHLPS